VEPIMSLDTRASPPTALERAWYAGEIARFCLEPADSVLRRLARRNTFPLNDGQRDAWIERIRRLQAALKSRIGRIYLEFAIPRMGNRVDAVAVVGPAGFVLEFKIGERAIRGQDMDQVVDDALDPEYLISCLDRYEDWALVICLVGGGQEIHRGEAGIREWLVALRRSFRDWTVYISDQLADAE
jgi:hypothetical protein